MFFSIKTPVYAQQHVSECKWTGFFMAGPKDNPLWRFGRDFFYKYWEENDVLITYLLIDYVIALAYRNFESIHNIIDEGTLYTDQLWTLISKLNEPFNDTDFCKITTALPFHKLSYKRKLIEYENGYLTNYGKIIENFK